MSERINTNRPPADGVYLYPRSKSLADPQRIVVDLIEHLNCSQRNGMSSSAMLDSPLKHEFAELQSSPEFTHGLFDHNTTNAMSIIPCGAILAFECSNMTLCSKIHLLTGVRVYSVWPPTSRDMNLFHLNINDLSEAGHTNTCAQLECGITFVQRPGQLVTLPRSVRH
jgi:hypothetical protein